MRFLVTGGAGFIGSHFCERLLSDGHQPVVLDDFNDFYRPEIKRANIATFKNDAVVIEGDFRDAATVSTLFKTYAFDAVAHIGARAGVRPSIQNPHLYISTNVTGTLNLLEACREHGVKKFVFASSSSIYGVNGKVPFSEDDPVYSTLSPYASTKLCGEQLCSNYAKLHGIRAVCLRFFTVYGPRQRPDLAIHKFARAILDGHPIDQYGDGSTQRDYTYISDILDGISKAAQYDDSPFEIINLGESETTSLLSLVSILEKALQKKAQVRLLPEQPGDVPLTYADISKARRLLGYAPTTTVEQGIPKFVEWLTQKRHTEHTA